MGNQLFVCCLKGSLWVTFREFRFKVLKRWTAEENHLCILLFKYVCNAQNTTFDNKIVFNFRDIKPQSHFRIFM